MTITRMLLTSAAALALLVALPTGGSDLGPDHAFAKGGGGGAGGGNGGGNGGGGNGGGGAGGGNGGGGAGGGNGGAGGAGGAAGSAGSGSASAGGAGSEGSKGDGGNDKEGSLAAFVASPVYGRVASTVPTTVTASPVVVSRLGGLCQTLTQTIDIGGQTVHASAVVCRHPDGTWRLNPTQSARLVPTPAAQ